MGSLEERLTWLERVRRGEVCERKVNPRGGTVEVATSVRDRILASKAADALRREMEERDRELVTREQFEAGCTSIALVVRDKLRSIAARIGGQDLALVKRIESEIDDALEDAAVELERQLEVVLG